MNLKKIVIILDHPDEGPLLNRIWKGLCLVGAIGTGAVPKDYFGIVERFSVFAAVGFNAVLGLYLFDGFRKAQS